MSLNPYESPAADAGFKEPGPPPYFNAAQKTEVVGLILAILAGISLALQAVGLVIRMVSVGMVMTDSNLRGSEDATPIIAMVVAGLVTSLALMTINGLTLYGGLQMRKLESYKLCCAGAILACIPCCSPCSIVGIPFGIWALVVLLDPQVKAAFRS